MCCRRFDLAFWYLYWNEHHKIILTLMPFLDRNSNSELLWNGADVMPHRTNAEQSKTKTKKKKNISDLSGPIFFYWIVYHYLLLLLLLFARCKRAHNLCLLRSAVAVRSFSLYAMLLSSRWHSHRLFGALFLFRLFSCWNDRMLLNLPSNKNGWIMDMRRRRRRHRQWTQYICHSCEMPKIETQIENLLQIY